MTDPSPSPVTLTVRLPHDQVLEALDLWRDLGILTDQDLRDLASQHLTCSVPSPVPSPIAGLSRDPSPRLSQDPRKLTPKPTYSKGMAYLGWCLGFFGVCGIHRFYAGRTLSAFIWLLTFGLCFVGQFFDLFFIPGMIDRANRQTVASDLKPSIELDVESDVEPVTGAHPSVQKDPSNRLLQILQALMTELSVRWILFLGLFLVVVSSGVLALSQWNQVTATGQYGILFTYTLVFWGVGTWTGQQTSLALTSRALSLVSLLLIPVNFWAMDGLYLWRSGIGSLTALGAAAGLMALTIQLLTKTFPVPRWTLLLGLGLSYLHWGWQLPLIAIAAVYVGVLATTGILLYTRQSPKSPKSPTDPVPNTTPLITSVYAFLILLFRATFSETVTFSELGLAFGISGAAIVWFSDSRSWMWTGVGFMLLGWGSSVGSPDPWQALVISGLSLGLLIPRLLTGSSAHVITTFAIGLQTYWLCGRVIPGRVALTEFTLHAFGAEQDPWVLLGLVAFPYLWTTLAGSAWLRRGQRPDLAKVTDLLALILGIYAVLVSVPNGNTRFLTLVGSSLTLASVVRTREVNTPLSLLTHGLSVFTILNGINLAWPDLEAEPWTCILLTLMVGEWILATRLESLPWQRSAWILGIAAAVGSYGILSEQVLFTEVSGWPCLWIITPVTLGLIYLSPSLQSSLQSSSPINRQRLAWWSTATLGAAQLLLLPSASGSLVGLGCGTMLMIVNTRVVQSRVSAALSVLVGILFLSVTSALSIGTSDKTIILSLLGEIWLMWGIRRGIGSSATPVARCYQSALQVWARVITVIVLLSLPLLTLINSLEGGEFDGSLIVINLLSIGSILYAMGSVPTNLGLWGLAWCVEWGLVQGVLWGNGVGMEPLVQIGFGNLALGLATQLAGDIWIQRSRVPVQFSLRWVPVVFGMVGGILFHVEWTVLTGFSSFVVSLIGVGVARRSPLSRVGLLGALAVGSLAVYEVAILSFNGANDADGVVLAVAVSVLLMVVYKNLPLPIVNYLHLMRSDVDGVAHVHWLLGSVGVVIAAQETLSGTGSYRAAGLALVLAGYACWIGRVEHETQLIWLYGGILQFTMACFWWLIVLIPEGAESWLAGVACVLGLLMTTLPWKSWGWPPKPWHTVGRVLPIATILLTVSSVNLSSLVLGSVFYLWLAQSLSQVRWSYVSFGLGSWAYYQWLSQYDVLWLLYTVPVTAFILYVTQQDPALQEDLQRPQRHQLRLVASGLLSVTAFLELGDTFATGLMVVGMGILFALAGLGLRVRAYLFVGITTFMVAVLWQVGSYSFSNPLSLWAYGIGFGILLIWVAANFETRRMQLGSFFQRWLMQLADWE